MTKAMNKHRFKDDIECPRSKESSYKRSDRRREKKARSVLQYKYKTKFEYIPRSKSKLSDEAYRSSTRHRIRRDMKHRVIDRPEKSSLALKCILKWLLRYIISTVLLAALMMGALLILVQIKTNRSIKSHSSPSLSPTY